MKLLLQSGERRTSLVDAPMPVPGPGEVLIRTAASALCGSEMHAWRGPGFAGGNLGHEAAGTISATGPGCTRLTVGQRVGVSAIAGCGSCAECAAGRYTWCAARTFHPHMHAEFFAIPERACHVLPADIPWDVGVLISGDGLGVPWHTASKLRDPAIRSVAVFGLGPIGLGSVLVQARLGRRVIGIDRSPERLALAQRLGAAAVVDAAATADVPAAVRALTGGAGADACIEAAGIPITAKQCFAAVRTAGTVVFNGEQPEVALSPSDDFIRRDITAVGSWFYHFGEYPDMLAQARAGLRVADLVTHRFPLAESAAAFQAMADGRSGKVLLEY
jgi:threonine dehydrogenase-like Zn-dependent dehydrogenase